MNLSKKQNMILRLAVVFLSSFIIVFLTILLTQSAHSIPSQYVLTINGMEITVGPPPNSTNVPLDTTITVDALASASLDDLRLKPNVDFASQTSETTGPLTYRTTFYPDKPLKPATTYNASVTITNVPISWTFTTTAEPFQLGTSYYFATNGFLVALLSAVSITAITGLIVWSKRKRINLKKVN